MFLTKLTVWLCAAFALAPTAHAANILVVSDDGSDINIAMALMADGHTVTTVSPDFVGGSNPTLRASLAAYEAVYWSASGEGGGDAHTDAMVFTNLTSYVMTGGYVFVTGYDAIASPTDPMLIAFLGGTGSVDVPDEPAAVAMISNALTEGVRDIRGMVPTDGIFDLDALTGLGADTTAVVRTMGAASEVQWTLRTVGTGFIAYVAAGEGFTDTPPYWTDTTSLYNAAIRNFAFAADRGPTAPCVGLAEGDMCTTAAGAAGRCRSTRCCTGCWDGTRCRSGDTSAQCGDAGALCASCDDGMFCTLDECSATGTCSSAVSPVVCDDDQVCTTDTCDEMADRCTYEVSGGCIIDGACYGEGEGNPDNPCEACVRATSASSFTPRPIGERCAPSVCAVGRIRRLTCDAAGTCVTSPAMMCESGVCADSSACVDRCSPDGCPEGEYCDPVSMVCRQLGDNGDPCADASTCQSGMCADGVCCDAVCDGTCARCDLAGAIGACTPIAEGVDPDDECPDGCDGMGACTMPDAGGVDAGPIARDGGGSIDGGARRDASSTPPGDDGGCGCHATRVDGSWIAGLVLLAWLRRRRAVSSERRRPSGG